MEILYILLAVIIVVKIIFSLFKSFIPKLPEHPDDLSIKELFKLADNYCWGMYPKDRSTRKAKQLLKEIAEKGTTADREKVLKYAETDCQSIYIDILNFIRVLNLPPS